MARRSRSFILRNVGHGITCSSGVTWSGSSPVRMRRSNCLTSLDGHQATISVAVLDSTGNLVMEAILETKTETILQFMHGLHGSLQVSSSPWVDRQLFSLPRGPCPRKPGSPPTIAGSARATTSPSIDFPAKAVLGCLENFLVRVEEASRLGYSPNRRALASSRFSFVLDMDVKIPTRSRAEGCQQRDSRLDLPYGCRESDLGSAAHSWRTAQAGFRCLGKECLAMDPARSDLLKGDVAYLSHLSDFNFLFLQSRYRH
jgi:hypothetical protein